MLTWNDQKLECKFLFFNVSFHFNSKVRVFDAVANFNIGGKASIPIFEKLNMILGK